MQPSDIIPLIGCYSLDAYCASGVSPECEVEETTAGRNRTEAINLLKSLGWKISSSSLYGERLAICPACAAHVKMKDVERAYNEYQENQYER
jgi:hypothetical protein